MGKKQPQPVVRKPKPKPDPMVALLGNILRRARRVMRDLGPGHAEPVYQRGLLAELRSGQLNAAPETHLRYYQNVRVAPDLLVRSGNCTVLVNCKTAGSIEQADFDDMRRILRLFRGAGSTDDSVRLAGLILDFGGNELAFRRILEDKIG